MGIDSSNDSNELNPQGEYQAFTVNLTDASGNSQRVIIPAGTNALARHPGYMFETEWLNGETQMFWAGYTPLGELRIPLSYFGDVDLSAVAEVAVIFDQTPSGAVMLSGMYLK